MINCLRLSPHTIDNKKQSYLNITIKRHQIFVSNITSPQNSQYILYKLRYCANLQGHPIYFVGNTKTHKRQTKIFANGLDYATHFKLCVP